MWSTSSSPSPSRGRTEWAPDSKVSTLSTLTTKSLPQLSVRAVQTYSSHLSQLVSQYIQRSLHYHHISRSHLPLLPIGPLIRLRTPHNTTGGDSDTRLRILDQKTAIPLRLTSDHISKDSELCTACDSCGTTTSKQ